MIGYIIYYFDIENPPVANGYMLYRCHRDLKTEKVDVEGILTPEGVIGYVGHRLKPELQGS